VISGRILYFVYDFLCDLADCGNFGKDLHHFGQDSVILGGICLCDCADCGDFGQDLRDFGQDFVIWERVFDLILVIVVIFTRIGVISGRIFKFWVGFLM